MKTIVEVTQQDIDAGEPRVLNCCPIALAIRRLAPDVEVLVASYYVTLIEDNDCTQARTPLLSRRAQAFIKAFDEGRPVQPFTFDLAVIL